MVPIVPLRSPCPLTIPLHYLPRIHSLCLSLSCCRDFDTSLITHLPREGIVAGSIPIPNASDSQNIWKALLQREFDPTTLRITANIQVFILGVACVCGWVHINWPIYFSREGSYMHDRQPSINSFTITCQISLAFPLNPKSLCNTEIRFWRKGRSRGCNNLVTLQDSILLYFKFG